MGEGGLRDSIRTRLADGTLPPTDGRAWAGKGAGINRCVCCGELIGRDAPEFEPQAHAGLHAHAACFTIWLAEAVALRGFEPAAN